MHRAYEKSNPPASVEYKFKSMKLIRLLAFVLLFPIVLAANTHGDANLVRNPGFESDTTPVIKTWPRENTPGKSVVHDWVTPTPATPDYYNARQSVCDGFPVALARTGQGRAAIICGMTMQLPGVTNYKEYIQGELTKPLEAGKKYKVSFYLALDCSSPVTSTGIGALFTSDALRSSSKERLQRKPQVISYRHITYSDGWTQVTGTFTAAGGEKYITIGSFSDTAVIDISLMGEHPKTFLSSPHIRQNVYMYLDDVCVAPIESEECSCKKTPKKTEEDPGHYFLFVLDISNSMNESGKIRQLKKQIGRFSDSLSADDRVGIMTFADGTRMILPFTVPGNRERIEGCMDKIEAKGGTNGDLAIRKIAALIDSLHRKGHVHVILATDGIFEVSKKTKTRIDSALIRENASFCVLQMGDNKNADLSEIAEAAPQGSYHFADRKNIDNILDNQLPEEETPQPEEKGEVETVYYTSTEHMESKEFIDLFLRANPEDEFLSVPRK